MLLQKFIVEDYTSRFLNSQGKVRLARVRDELRRGSMAKEELLGVYRRWRDTSEYFVIADIHPITFRRTFMAYKCSKRGNDVYNYRQSQRFRELDRISQAYGNECIFDINASTPKTNLLFVTLTYDTKLCDRILAWDNISKQWNRYISAIRKKFGKVHVFRVWESSKKGYPHIHALMLFDTASFDVFEHWNKKKLKSQFRIQQKNQFTKSWHSNVDVLAVNSIKGSIGYLSKYLRKVHSGELSNDWALANMWVFRKRSYSLSGDFLKGLKSIRLDSTHLHNSNQVPKIQTDLFGNRKNPNKIFCGIFSLDEIKACNTIKNDNFWVLYLKKLPERKKIPDDDYRVYRQLRDANSGISEQCFSEPPITGEEITQRAIKVGLQIMTILVMATPKTIIDKTPNSGTILVPTIVSVFELSDNSISIVFTSSPGIYSKCRFFLSSTKIT